MAKKVQTRGCASILFVFVLLCRAVKGSNSGDVAVSLEMPRYAVRGTSVALHCAHNVQPELLYKVEWRRAGGKLVQYVRGRSPPFRVYPTQGALVNLSLANEHSITLQHLEFSASGSYSCEVSLETPIYTKYSIDRDLLVIQPQRHNPKIIFGASLYTAGDTLEASCTTSPAHPTPHITWLVNGEKVDESLTIPTISSHRRLGTEKLTSSTTRLSVAVSALRLEAGRRLAVTCLATIPAYRGPAGRYADSRNHTVVVDVVIAEESEPSSTTSTLLSSRSGRLIPNMIILLAVFNISRALKVFICTGY